MPLCPYTFKDFTEKEEEMIRDKVVLNDISAQKGQLPYLHQS